jgi:hypothetical protein
MVETENSSNIYGFWKCIKLDSFDEYLTALGNKFTVIRKEGEELNSSLK